MNFANDRFTAEQALDELMQVSNESCLVQGDVTDAESVNQMCRKVTDSLGPVDILVVNAACSQPELPFEEYDWAFFQRMLDFFVKSPVLMMQACVPGMKVRR